MSVFYIPPKDQTLNLSNKGTEVVTGLDSDRSKLDSAIQTSQTPLGIAKSSTSVHQVPARELDLELLSEVGSIFQQINDKKQELVDLTNIPLQSYVPGISLPSCALESDPDNISSNSTSETQVQSGETSSIISIITGNSGFDTPDIASATVRKDELRVWRAPYLEEQIAPNNKAFENLKYPVLNTGIAGQGRENIIFENGKYTDPETTVTIYSWNSEGDWSNTGWEETGEIVGQYYSITGPSTVPLKISGTFTYSTETFRPDEEWEPLLNIIVGVVTATGGIATGFLQSTEVGVDTGPQRDVTFNPSTGEMILVDEDGDPIRDNLLLGIETTGPGFFIFDTEDLCTSIQNNVTILENEIASLRVGLSTYLDAANVVKGKKTGEQLKVWSLKRVEVREQEQSAQAGIGTTAVITIDPNIPTSTTTFDSTDIKFDSSTITFDSFNK